MSEREREDLLASESAEIRMRQWQSYGYPVANKHMLEDEYLRTYKGRRVFVPGFSLSDVQAALKVMMCPRCVDTSGRMHFATQLFVTIDDDVMTVFKAMGVFHCHHCDFMEYHPLTSDPRDVVHAWPTQEEAMKRYGQLISGSMVGGKSAAMYGGFANSIAGQGQQAEQQAMAGRWDSAFQGMLPSERAALRNLYDKVATKIKPPPIAEFTSLYAAAKKRLLG